MRGAERMVGVGFAGGGGCGIVARGMGMPGVACWSGADMAAYED